jgi:hypothetical protein
MVTISAEVSSDVVYNPMHSVCTLGVNCSKIVILTSTLLISNDLAQFP